jgi:F0F1-type ATP synthase assembly protein I
MKTKQIIYDWITPVLLGSTLGWGAYAVSKQSTLGSIVYFTLVMASAILIALRRAYDGETK